jgi:acetyltransferase
MTLLMEAAKARGFKIMEGTVLAANVPMLSLVERLGFSVQPIPDSPSVYAVSREL